MHAEIETIRKTLPRGVELRPFYDQSEIVNDSINSVRDAILIGLVLASLIMVLFLRDWGTSLVAGLVIPATIAVTFIALRVLGESFNLMTLGGLAAAVGLVIDDAIVVVENIVMHRDSGQSRGEAIRSAIREIRVPLVGSTDYADRGVPALDFDDRRVRNVFPRAGHHGGHGSAHLAGTGADVDADAEPLSSSASAGTRAAGHESISPRIMRPYERILRTTLEHPALLAALHRRSDRRFLLLLYRPGLGPSAAYGRRRLHPRLHHAGRLLARRDQSRGVGCGTHSAHDAGSGEHVPAHRTGTWPGDGNRGQHGATSPSS